MKKGCIKTVLLWFFIYPLIFFSIIAGLGFYGLSLGIIGAVLALTHSGYRDWFKSHFRLSNLPGLSSSSPLIMAVATFTYMLLVSFLSWWSLGEAFSQVEVTLVVAVIGLGGIALLLRWMMGGGRDQSRSSRLRLRSQEAEYFDRVRQIEEIRRLDPVSFERFVGSLFEKMGYEVRTTALSGDEGVDLILRKDEKVAIVQCKRYTRPVGQPVVRDLYGAMVHNRADEAYLVTTSTITLPAQQWAIGKPIHLIDGNALVKWMESVKETSAYAAPGKPNKSKGFHQNVLIYLRENPVVISAIFIAVIMPFLCGGLGLAIGPSIAPASAPVSTELTPVSMAASAQPTQLLTTTATLVPTIEQKTIPTATPKEIVTSVPPLSTTSSHSIPTEIPMKSLSRIVDVTEIIGSYIVQVESMLGQAIETMPFGSGEIDEIPSGGEIRTYRVGKYVLWIIYDNNGIARGIQIIEGLKEDNYSLEQWPLVLERMGIKDIETPDVEAPAAVRWRNAHGYAITITTNKIGGVIWTVQIYKLP
ncbi:MAG: restriction endonuclease [Gammaproteobacteria bacterium]|nr:restriction endonuclease [Gammaproteobacteria bacterium]